jgi:DNA-binding response OmpR family regulator
MAKIMVVDDDKQITSLFASYLTSEGHEVTPLNQSSKAMETALANKPDLFILDLMMPEPDGFQLCRQLRKFPAFLFTPILIVTALNDEDSRVVAYGAGANDYLAKPFSIDELGSRVKKLIKS